MHSSSIYTVSAMPLEKMADAMVAIFGLSWHVSSKAGVMFYGVDTPDMGELDDLSEWKCECEAQDFEWVEFLSSQLNLPEEFTYERVRIIGIEAKTEQLLLSCLVRIAEIVDPIYCSWHKKWLSGYEILSLDIDGSLGPGAA